MIDDRNGKPKFPCAHVSFRDLKAIGIDIQTETFEKTKPDGTTALAVKIVKVTKQGSSFPKSHMLELLWIMGIDSTEKIWVEAPKLHRCLSQKEPVSDFRYGGKERTDRDFLSSGRASMVAHVWASKMGGIEDELEKLRNGGSD